MRNPFQHLPFVLVLFLVLFIGVTDLSIGADMRVLMTLLAPALWLGLYLLGSPHSAIPVKAAGAATPPGASPAKGDPSGAKGD